MNRIDQCFKLLGDKKALIPFITAGDPDLDTTEEVVYEMIEKGANMIELGVPFSDPVAEGPTIQAASKRALEAGTTLIKIFDLVERIRRHKQETPILLMMYINSIFGFGTARFFEACKSKGVDGVIVPDMPYEERAELEPIATQYGIHVIRLVAPTSKERIKMIGKDAKGFLYCVSSTGVTGTRNQFNTDFNYFFDEIKKSTAIPCAIGFGISNKEQAREMASYCDGVIIGSAIVEILEEKGINSIENIGAFIHEVRIRLDEVV